MVLFVVFHLVGFHADHLQEDIGDQSDGQAQAAHQYGDDKGVYPKIVIVPVGKKVIDAAQIGEVNLPPQMFGDIQTFTGPEQGAGHHQQEEIKDDYA